MPSQAASHKLAPAPQHISCCYTSDLIRACQHQQEQLQQLLVRCTCSIDQLHDHRRYISWQDYSVFSQAMLVLLDEQQIIDIGASSWDSPALQSHQVSSHCLPSLAGAYRLIFAEQGAMHRHLPCNLQLVADSRHRLTLTVVMEPGLQPNHLLNLFIQGQLAGLPGRGARQRVALQETQHDAVFQLRLNYAGRLAHHWRRHCRPWQLSRNLTTALLVNNNELTQRQRRAELARWSQQQQQKELQELQHHHALLADNMKEVIWKVCPDLRIEYVTASIQNWLGYSPDQLPGIPLGALLASASAAAELEETMLALASSRPQQSARTRDWRQREVEFKHRDNSRVAAELFVRCQQHDEQHYYVVMARSLAEVRHLRNEVKEVAANYQSVVKHTPEAIVMIDQANEIVSLNAATARIFGYQESELLGRSLNELLPGLTSVNSGDELLATGKSGGENPAWLPLAGQHSNGLVIPLEITFDRHRLKRKPMTTVIIRDLSVRNQGEIERQNLRSQLLASQRLESIGRLTGGVIHDFNNLLVVINGYADLCLKPGIEDGDRAQYLQQIKHAGQAAASMTRKLLAFSGRQTTTPSLVNVSQMLTELTLLLQRLLPETIQVQLPEAMSNASIHADPNQVEQVIINLVINARDAMSNAGTVCLDVQHRQLPTIPTDASHPAAPGDYVSIAVTDTGAGIAADLIPRLFEPFFTTKPQGQGTGLGLSVVSDIMAQHQGFMTVKSEPGQGACFTAFFPASEGRPSESSPGVEPAFPGGTETLLLVEDSDHVRDLARLILRGVGYKVVEASNGADAVEVFNAQYPAISLVIMDVVMPLMGGKQAMSLMQATDPDVRILFTSGYADSGIQTRFVHDQKLPFIRKPYSTDYLCARIRQLLDSKPD